MIIAQILEPDVVLLFAPQEINQRFATYYQQLYSSRVTNDQEDLTDYLEY